MVGGVLVGLWWFYHDPFMIYAQVHVLCKFCSESILFFLQCFPFQMKRICYMHTHVCLIHDIFPFLVK